jgi:hypothetical protein
VILAGGLRTAACPEILSLPEICDGEISEFHFCRYLEEFAHKNLCAYTLATYRGKVSAKTGQKIFLIVQNYSEKSKKRGSKNSYLNSYLNSYEVMYDPQKNQSRPSFGSAAV